MSYLIYTFFHTTLCIWYFGVRLLIEIAMCVTAGKSCAVSVAAAAADAVANAAPEHAQMIAMSHHASRHPFIANKSK